MSTGPSRLPGLQVLRLDTPGGGANSCWWGSVRALVKPNTPEHPMIAANEYLAARIAARLGLPAPLGELATVPFPAAPAGNEVLAWVSAQMGLGSSALPPPDIRVVKEARENTLAGVLTFDIWTNNIDRHEENIIYHPRIGLWMIDHDQAFAGADLPLEQRLKGSQEHITNCHLFPRGTIAQDIVQPWIDRIAGSPWIPDVVAEDAVAREVLTSAQAQALWDFLSYRGQHLADLAAGSLGWGGNGFAGPRGGS